MKRIFRFLSSPQPSAPMYSAHEMKTIVRSTKTIEEVQHTQDLLRYHLSGYTTAEFISILQEMDYQLQLLNNVRTFFNKTYYPTIELREFIKEADWISLDTIRLFLNINKEAYIQKSHTPYSFGLYEQMINKRKLEIKNKITANDKAIR